MATIVTRSGKGSPLTNNEVDANFTNLNTDKAELSGAAFTGPITTNSTVDGRDVATDGAKLDTVESSADVTDTANVTAAGALMDSELTSIASVKALNQGVATGDSPTFAAATVTGEITANGGIALGDNDKATFGASDDLQIYHDGSDSYISDAGTGSLIVRASDSIKLQSSGAEFYFQGIKDGAVKLYYNNAEKLLTTSTGINVTGTATMGGFNSLGDTQVINFASDSGYLKITNNVRGGNYRIATSGATAQRLELKNGDSQKLIRFADNGDISFYEDTGTTPKLTWDASAEKLSLTGAGGLDVTGTATMDGLSVDGGVGSSLVTTLKGGTSSQLIIQGDADNIGDSGELDAKLTFASDGGVAGWDIAASNGSGTSTLQFLHNNKKYLNISSGGDISFYEDTGTTPKLTWDASAEMLTTSGLTVDGDGLIQANMGAKLEIKSTDNFINNGEVVGSLDFISADYNYTAQPIKGQIRTESVSSTGESAVFISTTETTNLRDRIKIDKGGDISFYEDTGTTAKFFWDASAESLGIGTSSPSAKLHVKDNTTVIGSDASGYATLNFHSETTGSARYGSIRKNYDSPYDMRIRASNATNGVPLIFEVSSSSEAMRIDSSGNVGIGCSPNARFSIGISGTQTAPVFILGNDADTGLFRPADNSLAVTTAGSERMRIDSAGRVGIGTDSPQAITEIVGSNSGGALDVLNLRNAGGDGSEVTINMISSTDQTNTAARSFIKSIRSGSNPHLTFGTTNTERMRIDSSGHLIVASTSAANATAGFRAYSGGNGAFTSSATSLTLNRLSSDGEILSFQKDTTTVGSIGVMSGNNLRIGGTVADHAGFEFGTNRITPQIAGSVSNGIVDLGYETQRFKDLYLSGGVKGNNLTFSGNGSAEHARIDSSGNLLVGKTGAGTNTAGAQVDSTGRANFTVDGNFGLLVNRKNSDGELTRFQKDGSAVGSIGVDYNDNLYITGNSSHAGFMFANDEVYPYRDGNYRDATLSLGAPSGRWKDLYLSGGVYLGGIGAANKLDDYEEGTFTPSFSMSIGSVTYGTREAVYTKIGNTVTATVTLSVASISSPSGNLTVTGLPFAAASGERYVSSITVGIARDFTVDFASGIKGYITSGNAQIQLGKNAENAGHSAVNANTLKVGTRFYFTITYQAA